MPESVPANAVWQYDYMDHYRLDEEIIRGFLNRTWGNYKYFVKARGFMRVHGRSTDLAQRKGDEFRFWVPRALDNVGFIQFLRAILLLTLM